MQTKDLSYYKNLKYDLIVRQITGDDGTYYRVTAKELDPLTFYGIGDTIDEAVESLEEVKSDLFPTYLENGWPIPEPATEEVALPSGRFVIRTSPWIHMQLIELSRRNQQSLNSYINTLFVQSTTAADMVDKFEKILEKTVCSKLSKFEESWEQHFGWCTRPLGTVGGTDAYVEAA